MENKTGNREWVKTAAIVFLSILLVLTFFSNTIMNRTLPEVSSVGVTSGTITAKVRGSGTVSAIGSNEVKATGTRTVAAVKVKAGQKVEEGDVLFVMGSAADEEVETARDTYDDLYYSLLFAKANYPISSSADAYLVACERYNAALSDENDAWAEYICSITPERQAEIDAAMAQLEIDSGILADLNEELDSYRNNLLSILDTATAEYTIACDAWMAEPDNPDLKAAYDAADYKYNSALNDYNDSFLDSNPYVRKVSVQQSIVTSDEAKLSALQDTPSAYSTKYEAAVNARIQAESAKASAEAAYYSSQASYGQSAATYNIGVEQAQHKLDKQEEKIASLTGEGEDANVYAKVPGIVESVNFSAGDTVVKGDIMCTIEVPDQGYTVSISVTKDQANRLQIGDTADISNYYWGSSIIATVSSIRTDPKNPQSNKLVTFDIEGDVTAGQELKIAIGQKSASYDCIVPNSAVMSDSNGKFVLTVQSKQSPLGNRYFAKRVDVEVLGSDDVNSAVNGNIGNGDFVVTTSSVHINSGDQVRLSDAG